MAENQEKKQDGGKGILIIIAIVIVAVAAYFIVKSVNKKDAENSPTVSISEADKLELSSLNLNGKWEKNAGTDKFELNFKSTKELVLTQYDNNGEVKVKSDEGAYSVDNGVLNLTVTANGEAITAAATAVLSEKYLIIAVTEGNSLFAGTYISSTADILNSDVSATIESLESPESPESRKSSQIESSVENSGAQSVVSKPESAVSEPNEVDVSNYEHLSSRIIGLMNKTADELFAQSSTTPQRYDFSQAPGGGLLNIDGYPIGVMFDHYMLDDGTLIKDEYEPKLYFITVPTEMFFSYNGVKGKQSYTLGELKEIYGDKLGYTYINDDYYGVKGYKIEVVIDGYNVQFNADRDTYMQSLETPITNCLVRTIQPQYANNDIPRAVFEKDARNINISEDTMEVWFTTDSAFKSDVKYNLRIYFSEYEDAESELKYDEPFDTSQNHLTLKLHEGHNYYYIRFTANGQEGEPSNMIYQRYDYPSVWDN